MLLLLSSAVRYRARPEFEVTGLDTTFSKPLQRHGKSRVFVVEHKDSCDVRPIPHPRFAICTPTRKEPIPSEPGPLMLPKTRLEFFGCSRTRGSSAILARLGFARVAGFTTAVLASASIDTTFSLSTALNPRRMELRKAY